MPDSQPVRRRLTLGGTRSVVAAIVLTLVLASAATWWSGSNQSSSRTLPESAGTATTPVPLPSSAASSTTSRPRESSPPGATSDPTVRDSGRKARAQVEMSDYPVPAEIAKAGLLDARRLVPSESLTVRQDGAVIQDLDVQGSIVVQANDVTIRNVRVRSDSNSYGITVGKGRYGTLIENVDVQMGAGGGSANAAIGGVGDHAGEGGTAHGDNVIVRSSRLTGNGDGIKAANYSLYEDNYIAMRRSAGSGKHIDGIQSSGKSSWTARRNWIDQAYSAGHNSAIFAQAFTGSSNVEITDIRILGNWVNGGVFTIQTGEGKNDEVGLVSDVLIEDNIFFRDYLYGVYEPRGDVDGDGGVWADTGEVVPTGRIRED